MFVNGHIELILFEKNFSLGWYNLSPAVIQLMMENDNARLKK